MDSMKMGPRSILTVNGEPVLVGLVMRPSTTAPSRVKAALVIPVEQGGKQGVAPLPFAQAVVAEKGKRPRGWTPEFRLEMN